MPPAGPPSPWPLNPPGCQYASDPDCDDGDNGGGGGGGGSSPDPYSAECLSLLGDRPSECLEDPVNETSYDWTTNFDVIDFIGGLNTDSRIPNFGWGDYNDLISGIAVEYWNTQSIVNVNQVFWDNLIPFCNDNFPVRDSDDDGWFTYDSSDCMVSAYYMNNSINPLFSNFAITIDSILLFGVSGEIHTPSYNPLGNWGANFLAHVLDVQECKAWFVQRRRQNCI